MPSPWISVWILLLSITACCIGGGRDGGKNSECSQLEKAIVKFARAAKGDNYLLKVMGIRASVDRGAVRRLSKYLRTDLHSPKHVRQLVTDICGSRSRAFLSYALRVDIGLVDSFYEQYILPVKAYGRIRSFKRVAKLTVELLEWVLKTGYPVAPLRNTDRKSTQRFFERIQVVMTADPRVRKALRDEHFPLAYDPQFAALALTEARSLADLARMLQVPEVWLRSFARKMKPRRIARHIRSVRATVQLYKVAQKLGLLDLD